MISFVAAGATREPFPHFKGFSGLRVVTFGEEPINGQETVRSNIRTNNFFILTLVSSKLNRMLLYLPFKA